MTMRWRSRPICSACRRCARAAAENTLSFPVQPALGDDRSGRPCSTRTRASSPTRRRARNGTGAPISPRRWRIAASATRRAISRSRSTTARNSPARVTAGWRAFNITSDKATGVGDWRDEDLVSYLSTGHAPGHGTASGPMGEAVDHSFSQMAPEDIRAIVAYLRSVPADRLARSAGDHGAAGARLAQGRRHGGRARQDGVRRAPASAATAGAAKARSRRWRR